MNKNNFPSTVRAAVKVDIEKTELKDYPWPQIAANEGILKVEAVGVGGAEPELYRSPKWTPAIMGHQTVERSSPWARSPSSNGR